MYTISIVNADLLLIIAIFSIIFSKLGIALSKHEIYAIETSYSCF